ncbi:one cut domain family member 3-like [Colius striatus]|uniref:one cut domain family member 3-like n=1 Tax=Colius striatus TaxID=57412 RepID=UPI002B1CFD02|nr:one cut domain family member 3-like [Colius striatus]
MREAEGSPGIEGGCPIATRLLLRAALRSPCAPLRLLCRDFHAEELSVSTVVSLLDSLEPAAVRRVVLRFNNLGLAGLCEVLPHLGRFPALRSLKLPYSNVDVRRTAPGHGRRHPLLGRSPPGPACPQGTRFVLLQAFWETQAAPGRAADSPGEPGAGLLLPAPLRPHLPVLEPPRALPAPAGPERPQPHVPQPPATLADTAGSRFVLAAAAGAAGVSAGGRGAGAAAAGAAPLPPPALPRSPRHPPERGGAGRPGAALPDLRLVGYSQPPRGSGHHTPTQGEEGFPAELCRLLASAGRADAVWTTSLQRYGAIDYFSL